MSGGAFAAIAQKGDRDSGAVIVTVRERGGMMRLYQSATDMEGQRIWHESVPAQTSDIDAQISRYRARDPDLWIVEIEDKEGRHFLTETVAAAVKL